MAKNETGFKTLDRIARDPRVEQLFKDSDGIWVFLKHPYKVKTEEVTSLREDTAGAMLERFYHSADIIRGHTGGCCDLQCSDDDQEAVNGDDSHLIDQATVRDDRS